MQKNHTQSEQHQTMNQQQHNRSNMKLMMLNSLGESKSDLNCNHSTYVYNLISHVNFKCISSN